MKDQEPRTVSSDVLPAAAPEGLNDAALRQLMRRAGRRPSVPEEVMAQVKAAAETQWEWTVRGEQRRRRQRTTAAVLALAATVVLVVGWFGRGGSPSHGPIATIEQWTGSVLVDGVGVSLDTTLTEGAEIDVRSSTDATGRAVLRLANGVDVRLDTNTRLRLVAPSTLALDGGGIYVDTDGVEAVPDGGAVLAVSTAHGVVRDIGTRFEVRTGDGIPLRVRVRDGRVELERDGATRVADAGAELAVSSDGGVVETPIPKHGEIWSWTHTLLPSFEAEGRTLGELLDWAAREHGVEVRFLDPDREAEWRSRTLHGSIDGLTLDDALTLTLLGVGLELDAPIEEANAIRIRPIGP